jgi:hypothetical protein
MWEWQSVGKLSVEITIKLDVVQFLGPPSEDNLSAAI